MLLTRRSLAASKLYNSLSVAKDGVETLKFLRKEDPFGDAIRPDLILLDLNMPRIDGRELLQELKADESLKLIPVVVLITSDAEKDIVESYELQASCYVTKPVKQDEFSNILSQMQDFWLPIIKYPTK